MLAGLLDRDADGVDPAHLAGADPDRLQVLGEDDRVRGDVLADAPGEEQVAPRGLRGSAADDLHALAVGDVPVAILKQEAAEDALQVALARLDRAALEVVQDARAGLLDERLDGGLVVAGREEHLDELLRQTGAEAALTGRFRTTTPP